MSFVLGIIPARGGSKGIPHKNIKEIGGKPLIAWTIESALLSKALNHVIVSTDSAEIANVAKKYGIECKNLRPAHLSDDHAKTIDVIKYEVERFEKQSNHIVTDVFLLQTTTPLRTSDDIIKSLNIYNQSQRTSLISVYDAVSVHPSIMYIAHGNTLEPYDKTSIIQRRQDMKSVYIRNGAIYISSKEQIFEHNRLVCDTPAFYTMDRTRSVNIDETFDLELSEWLLRKEQHAHS